MLIVIEVWNEIFCALWQTLNATVTNMRCSCFTDIYEMQVYNLLLRGCETTKNSEMFFFILLCSWCFRFVRPTAAMWSSMTEVAWSVWRNIFDSWLAERVWHDWKHVQWTLFSQQFTFLAMNSISRSVGAKNIIQILFLRLGTDRKPFLKINLYFSDKNVLAWG